MRLLTYLHTKNLQKQIRNERFMAPQSRGGENLKKKTIEHYKIGSQTPQKFFVCSSVAISVQR
jgi:hypothetical protein